jgi:hypothetical protein
MGIESVKIVAMNFLDKYPDLLTVNQVAEILILKPQTIYGLRGLKRTRVGNGQGMIRFKKTDFIDYINSGMEEVNLDANKKKERHWKVGLSDMFSWKEVQAIRMEHKG